MYHGVSIQVKIDDKLFLVIGWIYRRKKAGRETWPNFYRGKYIRFHL